MSHQGVYICTAYGNNGDFVSAEATLEVRDVCAAARCTAPKTCVPGRQRNWVIEFREWFLFLFANPVGSNQLVITTKKFYFS